MKSKKWNRRIRKMISENNNSGSEVYKVKRVPIRKRRKKPCDYTITSATNYVYFENLNKSDWSY